MVNNGPGIVGHVGRVSGYDGMNEEAGRNEKGSKSANEKRAYSRQLVKLNSKRAM